MKKRAFSAIAGILTAGAIFNSAKANQDILVDNERLFADAVYETLQDYQKNYLKQGTNKVEAQMKVEIIISQLDMPTIKKFALECLKQSSSQPQTDSLTFCMTPFKNALSLADEKINKDGISDEEALIGYSLFSPEIDRKTLPQNVSSQQIELAKIVTFSQLDNLQYKQQLIDCQSQKLQTAKNADRVEKLQITTACAKDYTSQYNQVFQKVLSELK